MSRNVYHPEGYTEDNNKIIGQPFMSAITNILGCEGTVIETTGTI